MQAGEGKPTENHGNHYSNSGVKEMRDAPFGCIDLRGRGRYSDSGKMPLQNLGLLFE